MNEASKRLDGVILRPLRDGAELKRLTELAAADDHLALAPTYVIEKGGHIVGYVGLNSLPMFQGWFDTRRMGPRDSVTVFNCVENIARMQGAKHLGLLLPLTSPFTGRVKELGYEHISTVGLELKLLT